MLKFKIVVLGKLNLSFFRGVWLDKKVKNCFIVDLLFYATANNYIFKNVIDDVISFSGRSWQRTTDK